MKRMRYLLPLGILMMLILTGAGAGQGGTVEYLKLLAKFQCDRGFTRPGYSVYVVGGRPELGDWDLTKAVKLDPSRYPTWAGTLEFTGVKPGDVVEWKCIVRSESNPADVQWQPDPNNRVTMDFSPVQTIGSF
jgi:hypothetical protein